MSPLIEIRNARKKFMGTPVLDGITLSIEAGERIAMLGPNGAGKTTLVRSMLGFYHLDEGEIRVMGKDPIRDRVEVLRHIGFIPQLPPPVKLSLDELLMYIERSTGTPKGAVIAQAERMALDVKQHASKPFFKLSGGMKQKLLIAIALARRSRLFVFDEPTASLDPKARELFYRLLSDLDYDYSAIYITHRLEELEGLINRKIYMELGKVVEDEPIAT
ncbi:ABC transporter ATP-binding protein [Nitratifractor salsuginis]|uniref:ABC transporter related protein n=1 Tax=Nitratifractor salsuginis (strain DSM 16511 / JCM 12458 / E9I37-1) TaxID=749222 RepID=E6X0Q2_NITSE|nr:ABC transporter ATP-binding protein [Nitratifractor salsuginis]ADV45772.1 ABC transporter related protein [Nitratifractor salsuginis DSM 16511]